MKSNLIVSLAFAFVVTVCMWILFGRFSSSNNHPQQQQTSLRATDDDQCTEGCHQSDEMLVKLIREKFLKPPSVLPYNFTKNPPEIKGQIGQPEKVDVMLGGQRSGFFVECGAHDGEEYSNSLLFELERDWRGLLIEADPSSFSLLTAKHRRVYSLNACLALGETSAKVAFLQAHAIGGIVGLPETPNLKKMRTEMDAETGGTSKVMVQCFPFFSVIKALGNPVIDYFSLDVEGAEMMILKTIPWEEVTIRIFTIEYNTDGVIKSEMTEYLNSKGYTMVLDIGGQDLIFVHKDANVTAGSI